MDVPTLSPGLLTKDLIRIIKGFILLKKAHSISRGALLLTTIGDFGNIQGSKKFNGFYSYSDPNQNNRKNSSIMVL